ncbi:hypothetical protein, conserved [Babesia bigemina]|uniref:DUF6832 domain-containing protein n=1 Tax=Babesia bigemina TaxID=5866 RepID=A0A061DE14_BABBI|nr:hypothetical protein, conserved [Babesia bigemina]CDR97869.1 hypothetical protein, conserved [Babesia bigemina]|eukprot:XP_012770055.1 hypothetical protein, conserved [Babesia bigemina]
MLGLSRSFRALQSAVATGQVATREYLESFEPRSLRRLKVFDSTPPDDIRRVYFERLTANYSNPRSILNYIAVDDYPCYSWLVRCLCQLGNAFSFNSFWSPKDRQSLVSLPLFKYLIYDLIERKRYLQPRHAPRVLFALTALDYRCWPLISEILSLVERNLDNWRLPTLGCMIFCCVYLGLHNTPVGSIARVGGGATSGNNIVDVLFNEVLRRDPSDAKPFDWALLSYSLVLTNRYEWPSNSTSALPVFLERACEHLTLETLPLSGWTQYILYLTLYCTDVERPMNEIAIKSSVPFMFQESLHVRWLNEILVHAQPQGSEQLQKDVDSVLEGLGITEGLINCSIGREDDEQHCLFAGHVFPNRRLCLEYNYMKGLPSGEPVEGGLISFRHRIFRKCGYSVAVIHGNQWDGLSLAEKEEQLMRILSAFPELPGETYESKPEPLSFEEHAGIKHMKHVRPQMTSWPPEKIMV